MNYCRFRFTLDIHKHQSQISVPVMYGDTAVQLLITLSDGGMPYTIGKSCWAQFVANKPGVDEPLTRVCLIEDGTTIRLDFDPDITDVAGVFDCEIRLYGAEGILTSPCFTMVVDPRVVNDNVFDEMGANGYFDQIGLAMASFQEAEGKRESAEQGRVKAEEERVAKFGELELNLSESIKGITYDWDTNTFSVERHDGNTYRVEHPDFARGEDLWDEATNRISADYDIKQTFEAEIEKQNRRISNLEQHISDDYFVTDKSVAYKKAVPARACTSAKLCSLGGMTYKSNNRLPYPFYFTSGTTNGVTITANENQSISLVGTPTVNTSVQLAYKNISATKGTTFTLANSGAWLGTKGYAYVELRKQDGTTSYVNVNHQPVTFTTEDDCVLTIGIIVKTGNTFNETITIMLNEGSTALPFEPYYEGLRDSKVTEIKSKSRNIWDEQVTGATLNASTGETLASPMVCSANFIPCEPNTEYYFYVQGKSHYMNICFYAKDKSFISALNWGNVQTGKKTTPDGCYFMKFNCSSAYGTTYNNDICISLSDELNGTYTPYREPISYPIPAEIQALEGYGKDGFVVDLEKQTSDYNGETNPLPVYVDRIIEVEGGGSLEFVNEYKNPVPSAVKYLLKEESSV